MACCVDYAPGFILQMLQVRVYFILHNVHGVTRGFKVFMDIVMVLATMSISKALDNNGNEITPPTAFGGSFTRQDLIWCFIAILIDGSLYCGSPPLPFKCTIRPRSVKSLALLQAVDH